MTDGGTVPGCGRGKGWNVRLLKEGRRGGEVEIREEPRVDPEEVHTGVFGRSAFKRDGGLSAIDVEGRVGMLLLRAAIVPVRFVCWV